MREARQEDKLQACLTLRWAGADAYDKQDIGRQIVEWYPEKGLNCDDGHDPKERV